MRQIVVIALIVLLSACNTTSLSERFSDSRNESLIRKMIEGANPALADANITVTSFGGVVLLTGQVSSADLIPEVTQLIEPLRNVSKIHNELQVAGPTSLISRTNDAWLSTKMKTALSASEDIDATRVKVVTENQTAYLLGLVSRAEADQIVEAARNVQGIQKIVKLFDYMN